MKNKQLFILALLILLSSSNTYAQELCSKNGYAVVTINGIFTDEMGAINNSNKLRNKLPPTYNNQKITVDYIYNPTHLAGAGDLVDAVRQGLFDPKSDYDLVEMLDDASEKVKTQKLLIVGHSQGNFYANSFYNKIVGKVGGVPPESMGVYSVATPDKYVAGGGRYLTSDSDRVIAVSVDRFKKILEPNTHIKLEDANDNGHSFSDVYLKYRSERVVADIKYSFDNLKTNTIQDIGGLCISPQKITALHKVVGVTLAAADYTVETNLKIKSTVQTAVISTAKFAVNTEVKVVKYIYNKVTTTTKSLASTFIKLAKNSLALVNFSSDKEKEILVSAEESLAVEPVIILPEVEEVVVENPVPDIAAGVTDSVAQTETPPQTIETLVVVAEEESHAGGGGGGGSNSAPEVVVIPEPVIPDTTAPTITLLGENNITIDKNTTYTDLGVTLTDNIEGMITLAILGEVNTSVVDMYNIVYTATDIAKNSSSLIRIVNVVELVALPVAPITSASAKISFPIDGISIYDGVGPNIGTRNNTIFTFQIVYTDSNGNAPQSVKLNVKNIATGIYFPPVVMTKISPSYNILNDGKYYNGELFTTTSTYETGEYTYDFVAYDKDGYSSNLINKAKDDTDLKFVVNLSTYYYIPKYSFGLDDEGRNWQVWAFNGSHVYDWTDTYKNNYLHEEFKMRTGKPTIRCNLCLERGIFKHNPQEGFEKSDVALSYLENSPQNKADDKIYNVIIQWDSLGYTYTIYQDSIVYSTAHINVTNMNNNLWVGWDGSQNNFTTFPSGVWRGDTVNLDSKTGGSNMILMPYIVYDPLGIKTPEPTLPPQGPAPILSSQKNITSFNFESLTSVVSGVIDDTTHTINLTVPYDTDISKIIPKIIVSGQATILPSSLAIQDFTNTVTYIVTAEDKTEQSYLVSVVVLPNPNPVIPPVVIDITSPLITSYTLGGNQDSITVNPKINNLSIVLNASEKVNWLTIKIEKDNDETFHRLFQTSGTCVDNTNICNKIWIGDISGGAALLNGVYKIRVRMEDAAENLYDEYLDSTITVVGQSL